MRQPVERRTFAFHNQRRTNLLLGLMRNHELRVDDLDHYTEILRETEQPVGESPISHAATAPEEPSTSDQDES
ncbi:MAG: hypothetical protein ACOH1Y_18515 [Propionicimonas sp.]